MKEFFIYTLVAWLCLNTTINICAYIIVNCVLGLCLYFYLFWLYDYCKQNPKKYATQVDKEIQQPIWNIVSLILLFGAPFIALAIETLFKIK